MLDDGDVRPSAGRERLIRSVIRGWRDSLVNLTGANRLLNLTPGTAGTVTLACAGDVLACLGTGGVYTFRTTPPAWAGGVAGAPARTSPAGSHPGQPAGEAGTPQPPAANVLDADTGPEELAATLEALLRRSNQEYLDRGVRTLHLACGTLTWADERGNRYRSPLLLVPVRLGDSGPQRLPALEPTGDDPVVNPALAVKLSRYGITLPVMDNLAETTLSGFLDSVRAALAAAHGWQVSDTLVLSCFSFAKEAAYRDLLDHEDLAAAHPVVAALAAGDPAAPAAGLVPGEIGEDEIDVRAAPEDTPVILDADASQRAIIAAALRGRSIVIDGPPGTGKSQTIANMIGVLLHAGRTVLFVSDKAAALDVVSDRLAGAGLSPYLLELHSRGARRHEVAASLGKALDTVPAVPAPMPGMYVDAARKRREQLNAYAGALNRVREPLGYSLHDVLGMIANLHGVPAAPVTVRAPGDLTAGVLEDIRGTASTLRHAWRPAVQGASFIWRGVTERGSLDTRLYQAGSALEILAGMTRRNQALADLTGLNSPSGAQALAALLDHLLTWPEGLPDDWLTVDTLDAADAAVTQLAAAITAVAARESQASRAAGIPWSAIPQPDTLPTADPTALAALTPGSADGDSVTAGQLTDLAQALSADAELVESCAGTLSSLAGMLGLPAPATFSEAADLLSLARIAEEPDRPERAWLSTPGQQAANEAGRALYTAYHALTEAEAAASAYFTADALRQDVDGLAERFAHDHHRLGRLSGEYRADKKTVAGFTREGVAGETAHQHVGLATAWKHAAHALAVAETRHAPVLGPYYSGRGTDFDRLARALSHAASALRHARGQDLSQAAGHICRDAVPDPVILSTAAQARQDLSAWQAAVSRRASAPRLKLMNGTITSAITWLRAQLGPLRDAATFTREVGEAAGRSLTFGQARQLVALRQAADSAHAQLAARDTVFRDLCGRLYAGTATDIAALRAALAWARRLRTMITGGTGPLTPAHLHAAESAVPTPQLAESAEAWRQACADLVQAFGTDRRDELAAELDDYQHGAALIEAMFNDAGGRDEWHTYQAARASLATHGLDSAVDFCAGERVEPDRVPQVIERALLREWAEYQLRTDPDLADVGAVDRDAMVREYQKLDRALIAAAAGDIIRACHARRPRDDDSESALIRAEAGKTREHLPVPVLIDRARHVIQALKPCWLMPPAAVSTLLPGDMRFDVVIFDEASQVSPADAIACIYRGAALILAGDQNQLPPAGATPDAGPVGAGWAAGAGAGDAGDPGSILDLAKASGACTTLALRWHYRSRHEALFGFSNAEFYDGRLATFPSSHSDRPAVAVELFWGDGVSRKGTCDNPAEAARVAARVIHHYDTRPALSLGVVTFSEAQASAVQRAVSRARRDRPDLDRFFSSDRLRGFFVKSAASVQGDERDVVILSIGYGPDENHEVTRDFGPLSTPGGWRRLNVAITRARYRNEIVSSIRAGDIPESVTGEGPAYLRRYLDYAARGRPAPALSAGAAAGTGSPFEESVSSVISSWGYDLATAVGSAGYRVDIGIRHPGDPQVFALGIECDGRQYHAVKAARDRDRLREHVLRDLGWQLHRIWSTAWYRDRTGQERRLRAAIEHAVAAPATGPLAGSGVPDETPQHRTEPDAAVDTVPGWATPYRVAVVPPLPHWVDPADPGSRFTMTDGIRAVVNAEAPVHLSVLHQRLGDAWNLGDMQAGVRANIDAAVRLTGIIRQREFLIAASPARPAVRTPSAGCHRGVDQVHDEELALALVSLVRDAATISERELSGRLAHLYGWASPEPEVTRRTHALVSELCRNGRLAGDERALRVATSAGAARERQFSD